MKEDFHFMHKKQSFPGPFDLRPTDYKHGVNKKGSILHLLENSCKDMLILSLLSKQNSKVTWFPWEKGMSMNKDLNKN